MLPAPNYGVRKCPKSSSTALRTRTIEEECLGTAFYGPVEADDEEAGGGREEVEEAEEHAQAIDGAQVPDLVHYFRVVLDRG